MADNYLKDFSVIESKIITLNSASVYLSVLILPTCYYTHAILSTMDPMQLGKESKHCTGLHVHKVPEHPNILISLMRKQYKEVLSFFVLLYYIAGKSLFSHIDTWDIYI